MKYNNKVILTDADGVLLNWEYAFCCYLEQRGHTQIENGNCSVFNIVFSSQITYLKKF